jgi:hypothetical protein
LLPPRSMRLWETLSGAEGSLRANAESHTGANVGGGSSDSAPVWGARELPLHGASH